MADDQNDSNRVSITLDLDQAQFQAKLESMGKQVDLGASKMVDAFNKTGLAILGINQAQELIHKGFEYFKNGVEQMGAFEEKANRMTALKNLAASVGVDANLIVEGIQRSVGGTIPKVEAIEYAFKLLKSGVKAETIPALIELGEKLEDASGGLNKLSDFVDSVSRSMASGTTRGMAQFGIKVEELGTRAQIINSIMKQGESAVEGYGEGFKNTSKKIESSLAETSVKLKKMLFAPVEAMLKSVFQDETEKSADKLKSLTDQLSRIDAAISRGSKDYSRVVNGEVQTMKIETMRREVLKEIAIEQSNLNKLKDDEKKKTEGVTSKIHQQKDVVLSLTEFEQKKAGIVAAARAAQQIAISEDNKFGYVSIQTQMNVFNTKKALIELEADQQKSKAITESHSEEELADNIVSIEKRKFDKIRSLRVDDETAKIAQRNAEVIYLDNNLKSVENYAQQYVQTQTSAENEAHQRKLETLRLQGLSQSEYFKAVEVAEFEHQQKLQQIKDQFSDISMRNFNVGLNSALSSMQKQYGSFSKFTESATTKTHSIMSKSFVDLAKGHGDAMSKMLSQFIEMIGTQMIESGTFHLLQGIATGNGAEVGAGAGLIAAGAALVGASGGSESQSETGGAGGGYGGAAATPEMAKPEQMEKKKADIIINGDFLNTRETANHLAEILRENSDITDYTITAQGKAYA